MDRSKDRIMRDADVLRRDILTLSNFIYGNGTGYDKCSAHERTRIRRQLDYMKAHFDVLIERAEAIGTKYA